MPSAAMVEANIVPEKDLKKVMYSGGHDATIIAVAEGKVDAGAVADRILVNACDKKLIDWFIDHLAIWTRKLSQVDDLIDRYLVDGLVNLVARRTYAVGSALRGVQTGLLRRYVMFIVVGTVALFVLISFYLDFIGRA